MVIALARNVIAASALSPSKDRKGNGTNALHGLWDEPVDPLFQLLFHVDDCLNRGLDLLHVRIRERCLKRHQLVVLPATVHQLLANAD
jgi:hypothetical protein